MSYKIIDLFAGIGGIRLGFDKAFGSNVETVFVSEIDNYARITYEKNFRDKFKIAGDITEIHEKNIPAFDICLAGFPCQAFSIAGKKGGFNDDYHGICRGTLFLDVVRICDFHKPKIIFCENVKGLVSHDKGRTFKIICSAFKQIGYKVHTKILNSKDFNLPQNRERIYFVCFRADVDDTKFNFPDTRGGVERSLLPIFWKIRRYLQNIISVKNILKHFVSTRHGMRRRVTVSAIRFVI